LPAPVLAVYSVISPGLRQPDWVYAPRWCALPWWVEFPLQSRGRPEPRGKSAATLFSAASSAPRTGPMSRRTGDRERRPTPRSVFVTVPR